MAPLFPYITLAPRPGRPHSLRSCWWGWWLFVRIVWRITPAGIGRIGWRTAWEITSCDFPKKEKK